MHYCANTNIIHTRVQRIDKIDNGHRHIHTYTSHSHKCLIIRAPVNRCFHWTQYLLIYCDGVTGGVLHEETLDLRQETRWDTRYYSTSDVGVLRQSCAHTQSLS